MTFGRDSQHEIDELRATIVRSVLVAATMKLLGEGNWYLPSWLSWLPDVNVEDVEPPPGIALRPVAEG